jgi:hypothetical protein
VTILPHRANSRSHARVAGCFAVQNDAGCRHQFRPAGSEALSFHAPSEPSCRSGSQQSSEPPNLPAGAPHTRKVPAAVRDPRLGRSGS